MEQLIFFIVIAVVSVVSNIIQEKRKREAKKREAQGLPPEGRTPPPDTGDEWPKTSGDWQETLRRMLQQEEESPPRVPPLPERERVPPVPVPVPRTSRPVPRSNRPVAPEPPPAMEAPTIEVPPIVRPESRPRPVAPRAPIGRTSSWGIRGRKPAFQFKHLRQRPAIQKIVGEPLAPPVDTASGFARRWKRNPDKLRDAIVASVILGPPKALDDQSLRSW